MTHQTGPAEVLTLKEAAEYMRFSIGHLSNLINGKIAGVPTLRHARAGRRVVIRRDWADAWLEEAASQEAPELRFISGVRDRI